MSALQRIANAIDSMNEWIGRGLAWLTLGMVLVVFVVVLLRYVFGLGWTILQESVVYMHAMVFMG
jgi:TRAP-type mannitol/chloroaromatic compound transport system permease small subunit